MSFFFVLMLTCFVASLSLAHAAVADDLPGWMGEIGSNNLKTKVTSSGLVHNGKELFDPTKVIQLSWKPRAFLYPGFLSHEECDHLKKLATDKLEKSMVADNESGKSVLSQVRTSSGMFFSKGQDEVIKRIEDRISTWTFLPKENGEAIQVLRYQNGEKYEPHFDYFHDKQNQALGGHRIATVLMYLSDVEKGGETVFPNSPDPRVKDDSWSECAKRVSQVQLMLAYMIVKWLSMPRITKGLKRILLFAVKPHKGDALLFFSLSTEAVPDVMSLHGSCPVIEGEKWSATKWIHVSSFDRPVPRSGACVDENEQCASWAAAGECKNNPNYMIGADGYIGKCRKSCKVC